MPRHRPPRILLALTAVSLAAALAGGQFATGRLATGQRAAAHVAAGGAASEWHDPGRHASGRSAAAPDEAGARSPVTRAAVVVDGPANPPSASPSAPPSALPPTGAAASRFRWPLDGVPRLLRDFQPPARPWLPGHRGVDLAGEVGVTVRAAGEGVVHFAGRVAGRGVVSVRHAGGLRTTYEPVAATVVAGERVSAGSPLGVLVAGHAGCGQPCLHWGLRHGPRYLDPLSLLGRGRVRLLPVAAAISSPGPARLAPARDGWPGSVVRGQAGAGLLRRAGVPADRRCGAVPPRRGCRAGWWPGKRGPAAPARL